LFQIGNFIILNMRRWSAYSKGSGSRQLFEVAHCSAYAMMATQTNVRGAG
jgi:hypothetical protein